jgi:heme/copper-type cytochrome/quinol oxidase subunit 3
VIIPYTTERRADTGVTNVTLGMWLFIASEVMLFGALFSAYALLRSAAVDWPSGQTVLSLPLGAANTVVLIALTTLVWRARQAAPAAARQWLIMASVLALVFLGIKSVEYASELISGLVPSTNTFLAMYFTLTGLHAAHVIAGVVANGWAIVGARRVGDAMMAGRTSSLALYWVFVDLVWIIIFLLMYVS